MGISDLFKKRIAASARFKEAQEQRRIENTLNEREKSSDEREVERFHKEEREKSIKLELDDIRKIRQTESMKTTVLDGEFMFGGKGNIIGGKSTLLENNHKLLSMNVVKSKGMFFK